MTSYLAVAMPGAILTLSTAAVFLYGGKLVIDGAMTIGSLVAFMAYHLRLLGPVQSLFSLYTNLATARVSLGRVNDLRRAVALVDQSPFLFNAGVAENIAYACPGATREEIIEAARAAAIPEFIESLPDGYDSQVGERGLALSAGERQRVRDLFRFRLSARNPRRIPGT